jgi:hypothetical protein
MGRLLTLNRQLDDDTPHPRASGSNG